MCIEVRFGTAGLDWLQVSRVYEEAPLGKKDPEQLRRASENSYLVCSAHDGDTVIGFGRALSDGEYQSAIYDVVVSPEYQGQGVGKSIVESLLSRLPEGPVLLYAVPGKEPFYEKMGFDVLLTGMGKFPDLDRARKKGLIP